jgi:hypothetical protein
MSEHSDRSKTKRRVKALEARVAALERMVRLQTLAWAALKREREQMKIIQRKKGRQT